MNEVVFPIEVRLASLALKGGRYEEAEEQFEDVIRTHSSPDAWFGLALAKLGRFTNAEVSIDEVVHAFEIARDVQPNPESRRRVETGVAIRCFEAVVKLGTHRAALLRAAGDVENAAKAAAFTSALSVVTGTSASSRFGAFASLNVFGRGVDSLEASFSEGRKIVAALSVNTAAVDDLISFVSTFSTDHAGEYGDVVRALTDIDKVMHPERYPEVTVEAKPVAPPPAPPPAPVFVAEWLGLHDTIPDYQSLSAEWSVPNGSEHTRIGTFDDVRSQVRAGVIGRKQWLAHPQLGKWVRVAEVDALRDELGLRPKRGMYALRCPVCAATFAFDITKVFFIFHLAGVECHSCKKAFNIDRRRLRPQDRIGPARSRTSGPAEVQPL